MPKIPAKRVFIGVDPGQAGGIAALVRDRSPTLLLMPDTPKDILEALSSLIPLRNPLSLTTSIRAAIEDVHSMPKQGVASSFKFGVNKGLLIMALTACKIPFIAVSPQRWQRALSIRPRGRKNNESKNSFKKRLRQKAQELYPQAKISLKTADALLIAHYLKYHARF